MDIIAFYVDEAGLCLRTAASNGPARMELASSDFEADIYAV
jgi:hypothetical protein